MTDEVKQPTEDKQPERKVVYSYTVNRYNDGLYDFNGNTLEGEEKESIDRYHIALDMIELARKLDHQLILEDAENRIMTRLQQMAQQDQAAGTEQK